MVVAFDSAIGSGVTRSDTWLIDTFSHSDANVVHPGSNATTDAPPVGFNAAISEYAPTLAPMSYRTSPGPMNFSIHSTVQGSLMQARSRIRSLFVPVRRKIDAEG